jgi:hypothetical protein
VKDFHSELIRLSLNVLHIVRHVLLVTRLSVRVAIMGCLDLGIVAAALIEIVKIALWTFFLAQTVIPVLRFDKELAFLVRVIA